MNILRPAGIARAISSAGGVARTEVDQNFQFLKFPNCYAVGEMLDWEAPTGRLSAPGLFFNCCCRGQKLSGKSPETLNFLPRACHN